MRRHVFAALMAAGSLPNTAVSEAPSAQELSDAATIIEAQAGGIRRWEQAPDVVVVHDSPINTAAIDETLAFIRTHSGLALPAPRYVTIDETPNALSETNFALSQTSDGIVSSFTQHDTHTADLFLFYLSHPTSGRLLRLTAEAGFSMSLAQQYALRIGPCYYSTLSHPTGMVSGVIFIEPDLDPDLIDLCIYEELVQAMGLVNDAHDSPWFTFDNLPTDKPRDHDARLLAALYDRSLASGAPVEDVLAIYAETGTGTDAASIAD